MPEVVELGGENYLLVRARRGRSPGGGSGSGPEPPAAVGRFGCWGRRTLLRLEGMAVVSGPSGVGAVVRGK